jgi:hypothetical protein
MLVYVLIAVLLYIFFRKEGLTTYLKYKEIQDQFDDDLDGETPCIYTQIPPQIARVYNVDFDSPFDRYTKTDINSKYNESYYDDISFNVQVDITKETKNNVLPFFKTYTYCDLSGGFPTCTYLTCGINESTHKNNITSHNTQVAKMLKEKKTEAKPKAINDLSIERSNASNYYDKSNQESTDYLNSIRNI